MTRSIDLPETLNEELEQHARYAGLPPEDVIKAAIADYLRPRQPRLSKTRRDVAVPSAERVERWKASMERMAQLLPPDLPVLPDEALIRESFYDD